MEIIIGNLILATPFIILFGWIAYEDGIKEATQVFLLTIVAVGFVIGTTTLGLHVMGVEIKLHD